MYGSSSELALQVALAIGAISLTVAVGLALQVLLMRLANLRHERRLAALQDRWRPLLAQAALGEGDAGPLPPVPARDRLDLLLLWNQMQAGLRGSAHDGLNRLAHRLGLPEQARRLAHGRALVGRVLGLATLGHLGEARDEGLFEAALGDPQPLVSLGAARALLRQDPARHAPRVIDTYLAHDDWPAAQVATLLRDAGAAAAAGLIAERLLAGDAATRTRLLPLLPLAEVPHAGGVLHRLIDEARDPQVLSMALRQLRDPDALERVRALAAHPDALVRSAAAVALGHIGEAPDRALLVALMSDRDWWVRLRAAQAVLALPGADPVDIEALHAGLRDRYARDALDHARAERALSAAVPAPAA